MSKTIAAVAGVSIVALLGATFMAVRKGEADYSDCGVSTVAGGAVGGPFELIDETGRTVTDADVVTEPTLLYFGYTFCPDVCPLDAARNAAATDILAESGYSITPVFASIDPARDTVEVVSDYTDNFHPKMLGLTGSEEQVKAAANEYRVVYSKQGDDPEYYLMNHSVFSYLVMPEVGFVEFFRRDDSPEDIAERIACFMDA